MDDERRREAEAIFHDLADLPSHEREGALAARCADDEELRAFVGQLLEVDSAGTDDVLRPVEYHAAEEDEVDELASGLPDRIGQYEIIGKIGEGGMGTVFEARQETPKRTVALKLLNCTTHDVRVMSVVTVAGQRLKAIRENLEVLLREYIKKNKQI